jgi:hypothetical protein
MIGAQTLPFRVPPTALIKAWFAPLLYQVVAVIFAVSNSNAAININTDTVQKSVVFLYSSDPTGAVDKSKPVGTGFIVQVPLISDPSRSYTFLVTARHIVDPEWAKCPVSDPSIIFGRVNYKNYDPSGGSTAVTYIPITLIGQDGRTWFHNKMDDIDGAVVPITIPDLDEPSLDMSAISVSEFPTDEETKSANVGDSIVSAGLLPAVAGLSRNYPIFKFGQISNIPNEDVATGCAPQTPPFLVKVWLVAINLVSGNSGSPIFDIPFGAGGISFGRTRPILLGVQSTSFSGADIAGMTPARFIFEIFEDMNMPDANLRRGPPPAPAPPAPISPPVITPQK